MTNNILKRQSIGPALLLVQQSDGLTSSKEMTADLLYFWWEAEVLHMVGKLWISLTRNSHLQLIALQYKSWKWLIRSLMLLFNHWVLWFLVCRACYQPRVALKRITSRMPVCEWEWANYMLVAVCSLVLALPRHATSEVGSCRAACNDASNGSYALSLDEVRGRGSPNRESQHTSQDLLVTRQLSLSSNFPVSPCNRMWSSRLYVCL